MLGATNQAACTCHRCGARYDILSFHTNPSARIHPDVVGDPEAVMLVSQDCPCVAFARTTLSIDLSTLQAALAAYRVAA